MYCRSKYIKVSRKLLAERTFTVSVRVGMLVFIKGRKEILLVLKPTFKEQIWIHRLENAQIANLSLIFEILFRAQKCSKQRNNGLRLLEMLKKPVGNCRNNLSCSSHTYVSRYVFLLLKSDLDIFLYPCQRPYQVEYTSSRPITEVTKH